MAHIFICILILFIFFTNFVSVYTVCIYVYVIGVYFCVGVVMLCIRLLWCIVGVGQCLPECLGQLVTMY